MDGEGSLDKFSKKRTAASLISLPPKSWNNTKKSTIQRWVKYVIYRWEFGCPSNLEVCYEIHESQGEWYAIQSHDFNQCCACCVPLHKICVGGDYFSTPQANPGSWIVQLWEDCVQNTEHLLYGRDLNSRHSQQTTLWILNKHSSTSHTKAMFDSNQTLLFRGKYGQILHVPFLALQCNARNGTWRISPSMSTKQWMDSRIPCTICTNVSYLLFTMSALDSS